MGLNEFRADMMVDKRLRKLVDFQNSKDCFPGVSISEAFAIFCGTKVVMLVCKQIKPI